jgi:hypothetical protein
VRLDQAEVAPWVISSERSPGSANDRSSAAAVAPGWQADRTEGRRGMCQTGEQVAAHKIPDLSLARSVKGERGIGLSVRFTLAGRSKIWGLPFDRQASFPAI